MKKEPSDKSDKAVYWALGIFVFIIVIIALLYYQNNSGTIQFEQDCVPNPVHPDMVEAQGMPGAIPHTNGNPFVLPDGQTPPPRAIGVNNPKGAMAKQVFIDAIKKFCEDLGKADQCDSSILCSQGQPGTYYTLTYCCTGPNMIRQNDDRCKITYTRKENCEQNGCTWNDKCKIQPYNPLTGNLIFPPGWPMPKPTEPQPDTMGGRNPIID